MNPAIFYPLLVALPVSALAAILTGWKWFNHIKGLKQPVRQNEKFLRSPGHSAFQRVESLNDEIDYLVTCITVLPTVLLVAYLAFKAIPAPIAPHFWDYALCVFIAVFICSSADLILKIKKRNNFQLGYRGERAVGEYLNQLMIHGCRVFHDFPLNCNGNLDHIVVAPSGVYAIETKARSKKSRLKDNHIVVYNGQTLQFPNWTDTEQLTQARNQAEKLGRMIKTLKICVDVQPILTFPGWYVDSKDNVNERNVVRVLNHKQLRGAILPDAPPVLSPNDIKKISAFLDEKCRDVAF